MIRFFLGLLLLSKIIFSSDLAFQVYVYDSATNDLLNSETIVEVNAAFIDLNETEYLESSFDQMIENGIIHINFNIDFSDPNALFVFDQPGLSLRVKINGDNIDVPIYSGFISVYSKMADRVPQIVDTNLLYVDYDEASIGINTGVTNDSIIASSELLPDGTTITSHALIIDGTLKADKFIGDGYYIYNVQGLGLNDDHSLERNYSRTMPDKTAINESDKGVDAVFISNDPRVGIGTLEPQMSFDVEGVVLFQDGESDTGVIDFPITTNRFILAWEQTGASFKAGYVSRDASVIPSAFSNASVAIGDDIVTIGWNSAVFGGKSNSVYGDYSSIVGGENHMVSGNYTVLIGGENESIYDGYVASVGGYDNVVSSNFSILLSASSNVLHSGTFNTIYGSGNSIYGDSNRNIILGGFYNQISDANDVIIFGDNVNVSFNSSWVINLTENFVTVSATDQVAWFADNGISYNTDDSSAALNVGGTLKADFFYGDGSQLSNISLVDKYWFMYGLDMTIIDYYLFVQTLSNVSETDRNQLNIKNGIILSDDLTREPGTISFTGTDLIGTTSLGDISLIQRDTDSLYEFSSEFEIINDQISLVQTGVQDGYYFMFNGSSWEAIEKQYWNQTATQISYDRPISFWTNLFDGMVSFMDQDNTRMVFSNESYSSGILIQNIPMKFGLNFKDYESDEPRFDTSVPGYSIDLDITDASYLVSSFDGDYHSLMSINRYGGIDFFGVDVGLDLSVPTQSQISNLIIDSPIDSQLRHVTMEYPFLHSDYLGNITLHAENETTINFRILNDSGAISTMNRLQISSFGEFLLSDSDASSVGVPMVTIPDGELLMDHGYYLGVFDEERVFDLGILFEEHSMQFKLDDLETNFFSFGQLGAGIRTVSDGVFTIKDDQDSSFVLSKGNERNEIIFKQDDQERWMMTRSYNITDQLSFKTFNNNEALLMEDSKIYINDPVNSSRDINVEGDIVFKGNLDFSLESSSFSEQPFITINGNQTNFQPLNYSAGFEFTIQDDTTSSVLRIKDDVAGIYAHDAQFKFTVDAPSYFSDGLFLNHEIIHHKIFNDSIGNSYHEIATVTFDDATGYTFKELSDNVVSLEYQPHFSTFNTVSIDVSIDLDTQYITPNGVDIMGFDGDYISVYATDGDQNEDDLRFYNNLKDGGIINGNLEINATLNVIGDRSIPGSDSVTSNKIVGDIHRLEDLPFPFHSTNRNVYYNDDIYNYQYIDNVDEKIFVGILTKTPRYPLEVEGDILVNNLINSFPSMNITGTLSPYDVDRALNFHVDYNNIIVTVNTSESTDGALLGLNRLIFNSLDVAQLNSQEDNYRLSIMTDSPRNSMSKPADMLLHGSDDVSISFVQDTDDYRFQLLLDDENENFYFDAKVGVDLLTLMAGNSGSVTLSNVRHLGVDILTSPLNDLVVSGNLSVGAGISGIYAADPNSLLVQNKLGIFTPQPLYTTDVRGTVVIGDIEPSVDNSLFIEKQLFIEEIGTQSVVVKGAVGLDGDLFFKGTGDNELSFMNGDGEFIIGYDSQYSNPDQRSLNVYATQNIYLNPGYEEKGIQINYTGRVNFGFTQDLSTDTFSLQMNNLNWRIFQEGSTAGDSLLEFKPFELIEDDIDCINGKCGVIGIESNYQNYLIFSNNEIIEDELSGETVDGADIQIDLNGQVDIGYNMHVDVPDVMDPEGAGHFPDDSGSFQLDVKENVFSEDYYIQGQVVTHMPRGSIIMWSGWIDELPDGWYFCTGVDDEEQRQTSACNFSNMFMVGSGGTNVGGSELSDHAYVMDQSQDGTPDSHTHTSNHEHAVNTTENHYHDSSNVGTYSSEQTIANATIGITGSSSGQQVYGTYRWAKKKRAAHYCCHHREWTHHTNSTFSAYKSGNSSHGHTITMDHNHSYSIAAESGHKHNLDEAEHIHDFVTHSHTIDRKPIFYTLAFIYLKGEEDSE